MRIRGKSIELTREARFLMSLLRCDLETLLGVFKLFDKYQEIYGKDAAIRVFDQ